jgi:hypothetical protein
MTNFVGKIKLVEEYFEDPKNKIINYNSIFTLLNSNYYMDKILEKWIIVDNCSKDVLQIPINPFVGS